MTNYCTLPYGCKSFFVSFIWTFSSASYSVDPLRIPYTISGQADLCSRLITQDVEFHSRWNKNAIRTILPGLILPQLLSPNLRSTSPPNEMKKEKKSTKLFPILRPSDPERSPSRSDMLRLDVKHRFLFISKVSLFTRGSASGWHPPHLSGFTSLGFIILEEEGFRNRFLKTARIK